MPSGPARGLKVRTRPRAVEERGRLLLLHDLLQPQKRKGPLPYREMALTCGN
jgi:hypothetical protein